MVWVQKQFAICSLQSIFLPRLKNCSGHHRHEDSQKQKREKAVKRLEVVDAFLQGGNKPSDMILDVIPFIPPDLRLWFSSMVVVSPRLT